MDGSRWVFRWSRGSRAQITPPPIDDINRFDGDLVLATFDTHPNPSVDDAARHAAADAVSSDDEVTVEDCGDHWVFEFTPQGETLGEGASVSVTKEDFRVVRIVRHQ